MTKRAKSDRAALEWLADALVEDILQTGDADLLAEAGADGAAGANKARAAFRRAAALSSQLAADAGARRRGGANVRALAPAAARRRLEEFIAGDPEAVGELVAAVRKVKGLSDEDVYGVLEQLQKRGTAELRARDHDGRQ
jgi:hypothetical protein